MRQKRFIRGDVLYSTELEKGHKISFHESEPGEILVCESGIAYQHTPFSVNVNKSDDISISQIFKQIISNSKVPEKILEAEKRFKKTTKERNELKKQILSEERVLRKEMPLTPRLKQLIQSMNKKSFSNECGWEAPVPDDNIPCADDGFWHSWRCDALWFENTFYRPGAFSESNHCVNRMWAQSLMGFNHYYECTGMSAAHESRAVFVGYYESWGWHQRWNIIVRPREWYKISIVGQSHRLAWLEGQDTNPRVHLATHVINRN